ncbi:MAG: sulfate transporter CysZ [Kangiellaceae bacterium]|jgi:CysZ protein|nr:sulfate transporter CysZ [Kangiellaceae bacterium]
MIRSSFSGAQYFTKGLQLVQLKGIRHLVLIPLLINFVLLTTASVWSFYRLLDWKDSVYQDSWQWVQWILDNFGWLIWPVVFITILIGLFYFFAIIANWLAAPFNGLLSEAVERHLSGQPLSQQATSLASALRDLPRIMGREWSKLVYWLPKALVCGLLFFIPAVNLIAPLIWLGFSAWMMAVQYIDYPMDNHKVPFNNMLNSLKQRRSGVMGFGAVVMLCMIIPLVNIITMPVAVAGATALWYEQIRQ